MGGPYRLMDNHSNYQVTPTPPG